MSKRKERWVGYSRSGLMYRNDVPQRYDAESHPIPQQQTASVMTDEAKLIRSLDALAQEHRMAVMKMLVEAGEAGLPAGTISSRLNLAPSTVSHHLSLLEHGSMVTVTRMGRQQIYRVAPLGVRKLMAYLVGELLPDEPKLISILKNGPTGRSESKDNVAVGQPVGC